MDTLQYHDAQGRRIAFRHLAGDGPTIVFLPGYKSDMAGSKATAVFEWARKSGRGCLLLDYSGCGLSYGDFAEGTLSRWLNRELTPGMILECMPPDGHFGAAVATPAPRRVLLIAVGSGTNDFGTPGAQEHAISLDMPAQAERFHNRLINACIRAHAQGTPLRPERLSHAYFQKPEPVSLVIEEVEALWDPIAASDDWSAFTAKTDHIEEARRALAV